MAYEFDQFCSDLQSILRSRGQAGLPEVAEKLKALLQNPRFVAETFSEETPPGKRELFHDPESDAYVLAHVQAPNKEGMPHSHGSSWAIYGNARGYTEMTEWRRVNPEGEERAVLTAAERYRMGPGDTHAYSSGAIHSTRHPEKAWVIRVTGTDLEILPRFRFSPKRDEILETVG